MLRCAKDYVLSWFFTCPVSRLSQALLRSQVSLFYSMTLPVAFSNVYTARSDIESNYPVRQK